jgi:hypothetical protein
MQRSYFLITVLTVTITLFILLQPGTYTNNPLTDSLARRRLLYQQYPKLQNLLKSNQPYKAPLHLCDLKSRVPDSYVVFLHFGYGLETHQRVVGNGVDWDDAIQFVFEETKNHGLYYSAKLDKEGLTAVRADIGVDMVECDLYAELIE